MKRFDKALNELRREFPTDGMESVSLGATRGTTTRAWWLAAGAVATAMAAVAMLALPAKSEAVRLQDIGNAIEGKQIRHTITYHVGPPEDKAPSSETWSSGKWTRMDFASSLGGKIWAICDGSTRWTFNSYFKTMIVTKQDTLEYGADTLPKLLESIKKHSPGHQVELEEKTRDGKAVLELTDHMFFTISDPKQGTKRYPFKMVWIANAADKLPREVLHYQAKHSDDGRKIEMLLVARGKVEYPASLPKGIFDHALPKGWKITQANTVTHKADRR